MPAAILLQGYPFFQTLIAGAMVVDLEAVLEQELWLRSAAQGHHLALVDEELLVGAVDAGDAIHHIDPVSTDVAR